MKPVEQVLEKLTVASGPDGKGEYLAFCPAHNDKNTPHLHLREARDGSVLLHCFAGCSQDEVLGALEERGVPGRDLFPQDPDEVGGRGMSLPPKSLATVQLHPEKGIDEGEKVLHTPVQPSATPPQPACTLEAYAEAKKLPVEFLRGLGLTDFRYTGSLAIRIPYRDSTGNEVAVRFRTALAKSQGGVDDRFRWRRSSKPSLYGLWRLNGMRSSSYAFLVEGESDCHILWHHGLPALGVPGASAWRDEWAEHLKGVEKIYAVIEPDGGGEAFWQRLASSPIREKLHRIELDGAGDISELHLQYPERFAQRLEDSRRRATSCLDLAENEARKTARKAWAACRHLALAPDILALFAREIARRVAGEARTAKLLYLALTSRLLEKPVSIAVKGPSSGGKTYLTEQVLSFFPEDAYHALTAMSEKALTYSEEPIKHRFLIFFESEGMASDFATYLIRSLLSEGRLRYEFVEKTAQGLKVRLIEREEPTGLIVTTTAVKLHPENETRLLSLTVTDTREQTREVLEALAEEDRKETVLEPWLALQEWLASPAASRSTTIPYARALARMIPPVAVRLRRDFGAVLNLIRAHSLLHQASREKDELGRVVATLEDYEVVRKLVEDLVSEGIDATVPGTVREAVSAVVRLRADSEDESVAIAAVATELDLDKSAASRRVRHAVDAGYLKNLEDRRGKSARLVPGDPLPDDLRILPATEELHHCTTAAMRQRNGPGELGGVNTAFSPNRCSVAGENGGITLPSPAAAGAAEGEEGKGSVYPSRNSATVQHPKGNGREEFTI